MGKKDPKKEKNSEIQRNSFNKQMKSQRSMEQSQGEHSISKEIMRDSKKVKKTDMLDSQRSDISLDKQG